jgi:DNA excision repair protein ERCC-4
LPPLGSNGLPSNSPARPAALLVTLARQQQQGWRGPMGVVKPQAPTPREERLAVLATLPGVGPVLAARLLDHFGSLRDVLDADAKALGAVPCINESLAARLAT